MSKLRHYAYTSLRWLVGFIFRCVLAYLTRDRRSAHDRTWHDHPAVATGEQLTFGQRMADHMRSGLGTWSFLGALAGAMLLWIVTEGIGHDPAPFILLNLCLSTLAGVQAAVLLIAAKRSDEVAAATALHTLENTETLRRLIEQNTELTRIIHDHIAGADKKAPEPEQPAPAQPPVRRKRAARIPA